MREICARNFILVLIENSGKFLCGNHCLCVNHYEGYRIKSLPTIWA